MSLSGMSLADLIRRYEQLKGGAHIQSLRKFHKYLKSSRDNQLKAGGPPPLFKKRKIGGLSGLSGLSGLNFGSMMDSDESLFQFDRHGQVDENTFTSEKFIERLNENGIPVDKPIACGQFGCVYHATRKDDLDLPSVVKIIPARPPSSPFRYGEEEFAKEVKIASILSEANLGPTVYKTDEVNIPLKDGERETIDFDIPESYITVYLLYMELLTPISKHDAMHILDTDESELTDKAQTFKSTMLQLGANASVLLDEKLGCVPEDIEWGYTQDGKLRIFDVLCNPRSKSTETKPDHL